MNILRHPAVIIVLILLVVLLFGSRRLPDLARSVGQSLKIFKKEVKELKDDGTGDKAADGEQPKDADGTATPSSSSSTPAPASTPSTTAATTSSQDATSASQQVPGLTDPTQPRA